MTQASVDASLMLLIYNPIIRPLGVRPLIDPERVPKPWGFFYAVFPVSGELA